MSNLFKSNISFPDQETNGKVTPLHIAAVQDDVEIAKLLLVAEADITVKTLHEGETASGLTATL